MTHVKLVIFVPLSHADVIRDTLAEAGCGKLGNYEACSFSSRGIGRFRPLPGANPAIGKIDTLETVEEERIETICPLERVTDVIRKIREAHPYEEPAIDVIPLVEEYGI